MFKKLFGALTGDNKQENQNYEAQTSNNYENDYEDNYQEVEYDPETLHGTHYTVEDFDDEVASRAEAWIADERDNGENLEEKDIQNIYFNYRREVYTEWNNCDSDQMIRFEHANSLKYTGIQTSGFIKVDDDNPFLQPVHDVDLRTYTAMCLKISAGIDYLEVCKAMGFEPVIWEELNTIWPQRMGEDTSFTVTTLFGQYYAENVTVPQLENLKAEISEEGAVNLDRIKNDRYFYEELAGARQAAYEYGIDGAQWILDNFGINLADFQSVAMQWMTEQNQNWNSEDILEFSNYQQEKQKEYAAKFAQEQGGNIADDVNF
nr:DUF6620 family protein [Flavobacterium sp. ASV13]